MNKAQLVDQVAADLGLPRSEVQRTISAFLDGIYAELERGGRVSVAGFGTVSSRPREARQARNPRSGQPVYVPAGCVPQFRPGERLRRTAASVE